MAGGLATALLLVGCSATGPAPSAAPASPAVVGAASASSPAAELQAGLTALLVERTYVVAAMTSAVLAEGGRDTGPDVVAARRALMDASAGLADVLGATYSAARGPLEAGLRRDDALLTDHAVALATGDALAAAESRSALEQAESELAQLLRRVVPTLDAVELTERLGGELRAQLAAVGPSPWVALREVAAEAAGTARLLAAGIASDRGLGSPGTGAARLRAETTALLTEHVALVGALGRTAAAGADDGEVRAALQGNGEQLGALLGERYPVARSPFLRTWQAHLDRLARYAAERAAGQDSAREMLLGFPQELARLLAEHIGGLPAATVAAELEPAQVALLDALTAAADDELRAPRALRTAVREAQPAAGLVAAGIAEDLRLP